MTEQFPPVSKNENAPTLSLQPNPTVGVWRRVWTLRCPICGIGKVFRNFITMAPACGVCGFVYEREQGYFIGAMYINYGVAVLATMAGWIVLELLVKVPSEWLVWLLATIALGVPICFYPYSKALWMAIDILVDPRKTADYAKTAHSSIQSSERDRPDPKS